MRSSNPAFSKKIFDNQTLTQSGEGTMTLSGTINKIAILLFLVIAGAAFSWNKVFSGAPGAQSYMMIGSIGGFIMAMITIFNKKNSKITAPIYAVLEGLFLGAISAYYEAMYPGLVLRSVVLTFAVMFSLLFLYRSGAIKVTQQFRAGIMAATGGIALAYLVTFIMSLFGVNTSFMYGGGTLGIIISLVIVAIAALNLVLDFDFIDKGSKAGLPAYYEWYGAFGLMVTLVWLYTEILRLLSRFSRND